MMKRIRQQAHFQAAAKGKKKAATSLAVAHTKLVEAEKHRRAGNLDTAQSLCQSLLSEYPDYVGALQTLGVVLLAKKSYREALSCFIRAAMEAPKDWTNLTNLAAVYLGLGAIELAAQTLDQARRLNPKDAQIYYSMGEIYRDEREYGLAADAYQQAIELESAHASAILGLGDCFINLGRFQEAATTLMRVHKLRPDSAKVLYGLSQLPRSLVELNITDALQRVQKQRDDSEGDFRVQVAFARAAAFDREGRHREAWEILIEANRMEFSKKHQADCKLQLEEMKTRRNAARDQPRIASGTSSAPPVDQPLSLFLLGASRSGKTTLERLVGTLERTKLGYESHLVEHAVRRTSQSAGLVTLKSLLLLPPALDAEFRRFYFDELGEAAQGASVFTNTHPGLIANVGRIAAALRDTRFIFIKRDPNDTALRMLIKRYKIGNHHAYNVTTALDYIALYNEMIDIWLDKLPRRSICVSYEDMIADPAGILAKAAELCGASVPDSPLPPLGDDRGCSKPYSGFMAAALKEPVSEICTGR